MEEESMAYNYDIPFHVDLTDRVALVTGGNGGIGGMFCRALAACGATVIVLGRNLERCQKVADEINVGGGKADAISGDVTDEAAMLRVKDEIAKKYGGLNILINAAGRSRARWCRRIRWPIRAKRPSSRSARTTFKRNLT